MKLASERVPSIRRRLLALLVLPATAVLLAGALSDYFTSIEAIDSIYFRADAVTIPAGETMRKRARVRTELLTTVLAADIVELAAILALVWLAVSVALRPLRALRDQIARRSARDLDPLALTPVPVEVRALVEALNRLFGTIDEGSRAQRAFLENATHQLRTPLAGIQAQIELLVAEESGADVAGCGHVPGLRTHDGMPAKQSRLARTLEATERLAHTTQQLLALARSEHAASANTDVVAMDLAAVVETMVPEHVSRAVAAGVDLGVELSAAPVHGSAWLIAEVVNNLVDNAISYTPDGGSVTVRCGCSGDAAFLEVEDTGRGIPADERAQITSRFFRGRNATGAGSGLGLAIVAEVARLHDARLTIGAGAGERGTRVRLEFRRLLLA